MTTVQGTPPKMLGRFVGALQLASATKDINGLYTISTTVVGELHTGQALAGFSYRLTNSLVDSAAVDVFLADNVAESGDVDITVMEYRLANALSITEAIANSGSPYFRAQRNFLPSGATNPQIWGGLFIMADFDSGETEKGPMRSTLTGRACSVSPFLITAGGSAPY